jgi:aryl-alcohol dehydrogenase-like predicted oxidoreductase
MQARHLKRINYPIPSVILGTANWGDLTDLPEARSQLRTYLQAGGFALHLSSEVSNKASAMAGELLAELTDRANFQIHFDLGKFDNSAQVLSTLNANLNQLGVDFFDLLWVDVDNNNIDLNEIIQTFKKILNQGKATYIGLKSKYFWQLIYLNEKLYANSITTAGIKIKWSLLERDLTNDEFLACKKFGISIVAERVLALGLLTGKYRFNTPADSLLSRGNESLNALLTSTNHSKIEAAATAAEGLDLTTTELSIAWLLVQSELSSIIINAKNTAQLAQSLSALKVNLPTELINVLDEVANFD